MAPRAICTKRSCSRPWPRGAARREGHGDPGDRYEPWTRGGATPYTNCVPRPTSTENNPYLAMITAESALQERAPLFAGHTEITLSFPKEATAWIEV